MADKKKHILIVSQYFYPEVFRINDISANLVERGYKVTVVTGIPNYPLGKFFDGYGYFKKRRGSHQGVNVIRIPLIPRGRGSIGMALNYASFVVSGFFWSMFTKVKADCVFIFQLSPATLALPGVWYAKRRKVKCTMYVQDLWPDSVAEITGISNATVIGAIDSMMQYIYRRCDAIFATSPSFVERIVQRGVNKEKVRFLPQYAEEFYARKERRPLSDLEESDTFRIVFTGNIGIAQGLEILPEVAAALASESVYPEFVMIGDGRSRKELEDKITSYGVSEMFTFLGTKEPMQIPAYLALSDIAFLSFKKSDLFSMTIPAKMQSYMACGMPILAVADGETRRIIEEAQCGLVCEFDRPEMLAEYIKQCMNGEHDLALMRENAKAYSEKHFDKTEIMDMLERVLVNAE